MNNMMDKFQLLFVFRNILYLFSLFSLKIKIKSPLQNCSPKHTFKKYKTCTQNNINPSLTHPWLKIFK